MSRTSPTAGDAPLDRLVEQLEPVIRILLPLYPELSPREREDVEAAVAAYVARQISAMPPFLRLPYLGAMIAFDRLPVLRYGARFHNLPAEVGASYLSWWTDAPIAAMRDFVRLIRSTALLVYFDHPLVRAKLEQESRSQLREGAAE